MNITPRVPGDRPLMDIGNKYKYRKVLGFIATEGDVPIEDMVQLNNLSCLSYTVKVQSTWGKLELI